MELEDTIEEVKKGPLYSQISRRELGKKTLSILGGFTALAILSACSREGEKVASRWGELERQFENKLVDFETFKTIVILLVAKTYVTYSRTILSEKEIIDAIQIDRASSPTGTPFTIEELSKNIDVNDPKNAWLITPALLAYVDARNKIHLTFNEYPQPVRREWGSSKQIVTHLTLLRSIALHELVHYDTKIISPSSVESLIQLPTQLTPKDRGFSVIQDNPQTNIIDFAEFNIFDEEVTDVLACQVSGEAGLDYATNKPNGRNLKHLFLIANIKLDLVEKLHRNSDIVEIAKLLSKASQENKPTISTGLKIMRAIDEENWDRIESAFPSFNRQDEGIFVCKG